MLFNSAVKPLPKLYTREELRALLAKMGRDRKAGLEIDQKRYKELSQWLKAAKISERHAKWQRLYDEVYKQELERFLGEGKNEPSARKQAHLSAKRAVMEFADVTEQTVLRAIIPYE